MNFYLFAAQATAQQCATTVDGSLGYPKAGIDVPGGSHVVPAQSITTTYFAAQPHPTLASTWIYLADAVTTQALQASALAGSLPVPQPVSFPSASI